MNIYLLKLPLFLILFTNETICEDISLPDCQDVDNFEIITNGDTLRPLSEKTGLAWYNSVKINFKVLHEDCSEIIKLDSTLRHGNIVLNFLLSDVNCRQNKTNNTINVVFQIYTGLERYYSDDETKHVPGILKINGNCYTINLIGEEFRLNWRSTLNYLLSTAAPPANENDKKIFMSKLRNLHLPIEIDAGMYGDGGTLRFQITGKTKDTLQFCLDRVSMSASKGEVHINSDYPINKRAVRIPVNGEIEREILKLLKNWLKVNPEPDFADCEREPYIYSNKKYTCEIVKSFVSFLKMPENKRKYFAPGVNK